MSLTNITINVDSVSGDPISGAVTVILNKPANYVDGITKIVVSNKTTNARIINGVATIALYSNDKMLPVDTYYTFNIAGTSYNRLIADDGGSGTPVEFTDLLEPTI